jgi:hypothetical protein
VLWGTTNLQLQTDADEKKRLAAKSVGCCCVPNPKRDIIKGSVLLVEISTMHLQLNQEAETVTDDKAPSIGRR